MKTREALLLLSCSFLTAAEPPEASPVAERESQNFTEQLQFSEDDNQFFSQELLLPGNESSPIFTGQNPTALKITGTFEQIYWRFVFAFPEDVTFTQVKTENSLYLEFNQTIDSPDLLQMEQDLALLTKQFVSGYNTLKIVGNRPLFFSTRVQGNLFIVNVAPDTPVASTKDSKTACARLLIEQRSYREAQRHIDELMKEYPKDLDVAVLQASLEGVRSRWKKQVAILEDLKTRYPDDDDLRKQYYDALTPHSSFLGAQGQQQTTLTLASIQAYQLPFELILTSNPTHTLYGGLLYQIWHGDIKSINNLQGNAVPFHGTRNQGELYLRSEWNSGLYFKLAGYTQQTGIWGASTEIGALVPFMQGGVSLTLDWHRPYWELYETLAFAGRQDRVKIACFSNPTRYFNFTLSAGLDRIGIQKTRTALTDALVNFDAYVNVLISNPGISFNYSLDADYVLFDKVKINADGTPYNPVPLQSYEFHSVKLYLNYNWRERWFFALYGGETFDRYSIRSPTFGLDVKYVKPLPQGCEIELSVDRFPSQQVVGAAAVYVTGTLTYRF